jgi:hypothetical protein
MNQHISFGWDGVYCEAVNERIIQHWQRALIFYEAWLMMLPYGFMRFKRGGPLR